MHLRKNSSSHYLMAFLILGLASAGAQTQDSSQDSLLNGAYHFRHVAVQAVDSRYNPSEMTASFGTITFDGAGNYVIVGTRVDSAGGGASQSLSVTGTYAIGSNGAGYIENPIYPNDNGAVIYGAVSQGVFTGSSTEVWTSSNIFNDIFVAIPAGAAPTNASFKTSYQVGLLDFPNAGSDAVKNALFTLAPDGAGHLADFVLGGQAANQSDADLNQPVTGGTYSFAGDGTGTLTIPLPTDVTADNALLTGTRTIFQSADGNFVLGWTDNGYDILFGVKNLTSPMNNSASQGLYFTSALEDWVSLYGVDSFYGSTNNVGDAAGHGIVHQRFNIPAAFAFDQGLDDETTVNADGSVGNAANGYTDLNGYRLEFGVDGKAFVSIGTGGYFSLMIGIHAPAFSGPGVYLNPIGVVNAANYQPVTASVAPGELLALYGSGLSSSTVVTQGGQTFPTSLNNVTVTMNGVNAAIYYVSDTAIAAVVPWELASNQTALVDIQVNNNGVKSNVVQVYQTDAAPGSFSAGASGIGYAAATHASNGSVITADNPVQPGETISLYVAGLGTVTPAVADGAVGPSNPLSYADLFNAGNLQVQFNDLVNDPIAGTITYAGLAPTLAGLYQINVTLPTSGLNVGGNLYVQFLTDGAVNTEVQIPYGAGAVTPSLVPAAVRAKTRVAGIQAHRVRANHRAL
jgi:uncharacterized protein (TIGR03437 family)